MQPFLLHRMAHQLPHSLADTSLCSASASHVSTSDGPVLTYQARHIHTYPTRHTILYACNSPNTQHALSPRLIGRRAPQRPGENDDLLDRKMSGSAALFVKQQLRTRQDMLVLGQILNDAMQDYIEVRMVARSPSRFLVSFSDSCPAFVCPSLTPEYNAIHMLQKEGANYEPLEVERMEQSTVDVFRTVKQFVGYEEAEEPMASPQLAPLSPPPYDPEVARLEEEVHVASERIQKLRVDMQAAIEDRVKEKILAKLPSARDGPNDGEGEGDVEMPALAKAVDAESLKQKLADAAAKMPGLKAKLDDVYEKMVKIIESVEDEGGMAAGTGDAPNTAERALRRLYDEPQTLDDTIDLKRATGRG